LSATRLVSRQLVTPTIAMITAENAHESIEVYRSLTYIGTILRLRMAECRWGRSLRKKLNTVFNIVYRLPLNQDEKLTLLSPWKFTSR
jgi:hypothetical protein